MAKIILGTDGSEGARAALLFAGEEATLRKAPLLIVSVWSVPVMVYAGGFAPAPFDLSVFRSAAEEIVRAALADARERWPTLECDGKAVEGQAAEVLIREAVDADLLVVGTRGLGGFTSLLLGSVSHHAAHHAPCPIVIVPHETSDHPPK